MIRGILPVIVTSIFGPIVLFATWDGPGRNDGLAMRGSLSYDKPKRKDAPKTVDVSHTASLAVAIDKAEYECLEPIVLHVVLKNLDDQQSLLCQTGTFKYRIFEILATDERGHEVPPTRFGERGLGAGSGSDRAIGPGGEYSCDLAANLVRDLTIPGRYTIRVRMEFYHWGREPQGIGSVTSKPVELKVNLDRKK